MGTWMDHRRRRVLRFCERGCWGAPAQIGLGVFLAKETSNGTVAMFRCEDVGNHPDRYMGPGIVSPIVLGFFAARMVKEKRGGSTSPKHIYSLVDLEHPAWWWT